MRPSTRASVQERAGHRCEYCQLHQEDSPLAVLHVEHIVPRIHGGTDDLDNLALACIDCNLRALIPNRGRLPSYSIQGDIDGKTTSSGAAFI